MAQITLKTAAGADAGTRRARRRLFGIQPNVPVMHQVVTAQLARRRAGTQSTKTRSRGPRRRRQAVPPEGHRQRPPGLDQLPALHRRRRRPRPQAAHLRPAHAQEDDQAGAALGAVRPGRRRQGRRRRRLGLRRAEDARTPRRRSPRSALEGRVLVVLDARRRSAALSFRNLPDVQLILVGELNAYDVLCNDWIVFTKATCPRVEPAAAEQPRGACDDEVRRGRVASPTRSRRPTSPPRRPRPPRRRADEASGRRSDARPVTQRA